MQIGEGHRGVDICDTRRESGGDAFALEGRMRTRRGQIPVAFLVSELGKTAVMSLEYSAR
jgi:hypothetical protein